MLLALTGRSPYDADSQTFTLIPNIAFWNSLAIHIPIDSRFQKLHIRVLNRGPACATFFSEKLENTGKNHYIRAPKQ